MEKLNYEISGTLRCKNVNTPGILGKLTTNIGRMGANIANVSTVYLGHRYTIRDIDVLVINKDHLAQLIDEVSNIKEPPWA